MGRDVPILTEKMCIGMIRTYPMQEKVSRQEHEGLGVSTRELSRVCSAPRSCPRFWHVSGQRLWASFRAVAFIACVLSLLLHLQRKYLGYFCRGDVTVWLHDHLHGFGEVRAAGTERGELRWATAPPPAWVGVEPDIHRTGRRKSHRGCAPCRICGIWGTAGHSGAEPWGKERCSSVERLVLKSRRWVETGYEAGDGFICILVGAWEFGIVWGGEGTPPWCLTFPTLELALHDVLVKGEEKESTVF